MSKNWKLGEAQSTQDSRTGFNGAGVVLYGSDGKPWLSFGFASMSKAVDAKAALDKALAECVEIMKP